MNIAEYQQLLDQLVAEYQHIDNATVEGNFNAEAFGNWYWSGLRGIPNNMKPKKSVADSETAVRKRLDLFDKKYPGHLPPMSAGQRLELTRRVQYIVWSDDVQIAEPEVDEDGVLWHKTLQLFYAGEEGIISTKARYELDSRFTFSPGSALAFNSMEEAKLVAANLNAEETLPEFTFSAVDWAPG